MQQPPQQPTLKEFDLNYYVTHYLHLLWRWKLWIVIVAPLVTAAFAVYLLKFGGLKPELEAAVMIGLEDSGSKTAVTDLGESAPLSRLALIKAKGFLADIVDKMSLRFRVKGENLYEIVDTVFVDSTALPAKYQFKVQEGTYKIFMWNRAAGIKKKLVETGPLSNLAEINLPGVYCKLNSNFLKAPFEFIFFIVRQRDAISYLQKKITVYDRELQRARSPSKENFVGISMAGRDYKLITRIINFVADEFVQKSLGFKRRKTNEALVVLEKQLQKAAEGVAVTQDALKIFQAENPNVALASELQNSVSNIAMIESSMHASRTAAEEAQNIQEQLSRAKETDTELLINEALLFLSRQGMVAASVLQSEYAQLQQQKAALSTGYSKTHPQVLENRQKISGLKAKTDALLKEFVNKTATEAYKYSSKIQEVNGRMQRYPSQQRQLAELERKAQVASELHSSVLARYNQAKIADAVEVPDVFIMDYAIEPEPPSNLQNLLKVLAIGIIIILGFSFAPPVVYDLLDKTARTDSELVKLLPYTFLEAIPEITDSAQTKKDKKKHRDSAQRQKGRLIDPKLVTASYTPDFTNELFRSLRSKIMLRMHEQDRKNFLITSLGMNEGKSLITANLAITMAQQKLKTILIDGDIRRGVQHNTFVLQKKPGLSDFLFSEETVTPDTVTKLVQPTHVPNLSLIASGPNVPNPSELLALPRFTEMINYLNDTFDIVILDTPPLGASVDAAVVSKLFSGAIIVVKAGATNVVALKKRLKEFPNLSEKIIGLVLNGSMLTSEMKKYKYYSYHY